MAYLDTGLIGEHQGKLFLYGHKSSSGYYWYVIRLSYDNGSSEEWQYRETDLPGLQKAINDEQFEEEAKKGRTVILYGDKTSIRLHSLDGIGKPQKVLIYIKDSEIEQQKKAIWSAYLHYGINKIISNVYTSDKKYDGNEITEIINERLGIQIIIPDNVSNGSTYIYGYETSTDNISEFIGKNIIENPQSLKSFHNGNNGEPDVEFTYENKKFNCVNVAENIKEFFLSKVCFLGDDDQQNRKIFFKIEFEEKNEDSGYGSYFYYITDNEDIRKKLSEQEKRFVRIILKLRSDKVAEDNKTIDSQRAKLLEKSKAVSRTAIMARNMSHNIGSHVLSYLKTDISGGSRISVQSHSNEEHFLMGLVQFIGYIQERQDYIATVATDYIPYYSPVSFGSNIISILSCDLYDNILLDNIAKSEGYSNRKGNLKINFPVHDSIDVCIPAGTVGRQAFFSIVENIIRNAAKHGNTNNMSSLEFTFDTCYGKCLNNTKDFISYKRLSRLYKKSSDINDLLLITITDNLIYKNIEVISSIRKSLTEPFFNADGNMLETNKGIKEIRISSAWLRGCIVESEYNTFRSFKRKQIKKAPLVGVELTKSFNLRYIICLPIEHFCVFTLDGYTLEEKEIINELNKLDSFNWLVNDRENSDNPYPCSSFSLVACSNLRNKGSLREFEFHFDQSRIQELRNANNDADFLTIAKRQVIQQFTKVSNDDDTIYVWDAGHSYQSQCNKIVVANIDKDSKTAKYAYRRHHNDISGFISYSVKRAKQIGYNSLISVDSITADNSTDKLVRHESLDEFWYYYHLYSLRQKVAIIDERIFQRIHGLAEDQLLNLDDNGICAHNYLSSLLHDRMIDIFTIVPEKNKEDCLAIVGLVKSTFENNEFRCYFKKVGEILYNVQNGENKVKIVAPQGHFTYDLISIHLGRLELIYKTFNMENSKSKLTCSDSLFSMFQGPKFSKNNGTCLGVTIHSGRAKPSKETMPQKQPFLLYSAVEAATLDCKYSIVSLLDHAELK